MGEMGGKGRHSQATPHPSHSIFLAPWLHRGPSSQPTVQLGPNLPSLGPPNSPRHHAGLHASCTREEMELRGFKEFFLKVVMPTIHPGSSGCKAGSSGQSWAWWKPGGSVLDTMINVEEMELWGSLETEQSAGF